jgi:fructose-bisphosphate aldolase, class II
MPLVDMRDMLNHAYGNGYAVGGFALGSIDFIGAIVAAAENCRSPVILSLAESRHAHYDFELAMAAAEKAAHRAAVPVAIHLDHGSSLESAVRAINLGCNGVTVNAAQESFLGNVTQARHVVEMAHACGVAVEGELGAVAGADGAEINEASGDPQPTSVAEAKAYVARTGVDCLAVSIGTGQGRQRGRSKLDFERLKRINDAVRIPLMIQNDPGLTEEQYRRLIAQGVAKINCCTALADAAGSRIRANARADARCGYADLVKDLHDSVRDEVERYMRLWGSAGRAAEVIVQCSIWQPVEHVIVYNTEHTTDAQVEAMMARGREVLGKIPGVRRVVTGWAVTEKPAYRFCWLIEFVHEKVIASYRNHPDHIAFASGLFRPIAGDRISIDFLSLGEAAPLRAIHDGHRERA